MVLLFLTQFWEDFGVWFVVAELAIYSGYLSFLTYVAIIRSNCAFPESGKLNNDMVGLIIFSLFFLLLTAAKWIEYFGGA